MVADENTHGLPACDETESAAQAGTAPASDRAAVPDFTEARMHELQATVAALRDEVLRARAEADNVRKRAARDVESAHKYALDRFMTELLPVCDSLDLAQAAAETSETAVALREGITLTLKLFSAAMDKVGVRAIDPVGAKFDPAFHQAMTVQDDPIAAPGTILRVMQKGYVLNERLIRPAMVVVARRPLAADA